MLNELLNHNKWLEFLNYKLEKEFVHKKEKEYFKSFILNKKYLEIAEKIVNNNYTFSTAKKHIISKINSSKKRIVYNYNEEEMMILKFIAYLLHKYDSMFSPNLYSFRKTNGVKNAINNLHNIKNISKMYGYKVDIKNYFNSIDIKSLLVTLSDDLNDKYLYNLLSDLLLNNQVMYNDEIIIDNDKGVMAGIPVSAFLANYYLKDLDNLFWKEKIVYVRYADDIIIFCNTNQEVLKYKEVLIDFLKNKNLCVNHSKEYFFKPGDKWEFLGFSFYEKEIDLSSNTIVKIKGKIRRSARGIRRWMIKNNIKSEYALKAMNRKFNRKFYGNDVNNELCWLYWFFPTITTSKSLKLIDNYMQENLRYIVTGKHNKKNYEVVPYDLLKKCNYRSLVNEYYNYLSLNVKN